MMATIEDERPPFECEAYVDRYTLTYMCICV